MLCSLVQTRFSVHSSLLHVLCANCIYIVLGDMFNAQDNTNDDLISISDIEVTVNTSNPKLKPKPKDKGKGKAQPEPDVDLNAKISSMNKGKGKSKEVISNAEMDVSDLHNVNSVPKPTSCNKPGLKKSRVCSPQASSKCRPSMSVRSPTSPSKGHKHTCKGMIGNSTMVKDCMKHKMRPQVDVEASDSLANLTLATALLTVNNSAALVTPDLSMSDLIHDSILAQLNAPGGQNDP